MAARAYSEAALPSSAECSFILCAFRDKEKKQCRGDLYLELFLQNRLSHHLFPGLNEHVSRRLPTKALFQTSSILTNTAFTLQNVALRSNCLVFRYVKLKRDWTCAPRVWALKIFISAISSSLRPLLAFNLPSWVIKYWALLCIALDSGSGLLCI